MPYTINLEYYTDMFTSVGHFDLPQKSIFYYNINHMPYLFQIKRKPLLTRIQL